MLFNSWKSGYVYGWLDGLTWEVNGWMDSLVRSLARSFVLSFVRSFVRSFIPSINNIDVKKSLK